ncbi:FAD dependent oxidoreductase superfamily protein [Magnaporthiopsis poae ATCC 64411]|uniref:FAD dependent oxidoreductase superfamily protein n=1 Tax=Magnaporthiopsis poae (strain ATCC 64411 / 73-15) TaxID=644358 RepID=A0A0C4DYB3_MAGP6|nr:FAD dependent oxidoreductase superfamily protein [Magnaporthiopsis poae ATCC 64411]
MWQLSKLAVVISLAGTACSVAVPSEPRPWPSQASDQQPLLPGGPQPNPTTPYWQMPPHRIADLRTTPELPTSQTFDYVIIGSGVSGTTVAYKLLSRDPSLSVLMLEARGAVSGATVRNGGHVRAGSWGLVRKWTAAYGEDEAIRIGRLEQESVDELRDFVRAHNVSSGFVEVESADLYWTKEAFENAVATVDVQNELKRRRPRDVPHNSTRTVYAGQAARDHLGWPRSWAPSRCAAA